MVGWVWPHLLHKLSQICTYIPFILPFLLLLFLNLLQYYLSLSLCGQFYRLCCRALEPMDKREWSVYVCNESTISIDGYQSRWYKMWTRNGNKNEWKDLRVVAGSSQLFHSELLFSGSLPSIAASENFMFHSVLIVVSTYLHSAVSAQMAKAAARSTTQWPCAFVNFGHCTGAANLISWQWSTSEDDKQNQSI